MTDTIAYGDILTNTLATWLANPVTQQDKVDNPITLPPPTAADAQTRSTAKVANTTANVHEKLVRWLNGLDAAGQTAALARFLGGISLADSASLTAGAGAPEGAITAPVGSLRLDTAGTAATTLYVKESGVGNTGWVSVGGPGTGVFLGNVILDSANPTLTAGAGTGDPIVAADKVAGGSAKFQWLKAGVMVYEADCDAGDNLMLKTPGGNVLNLQSDRNAQFYGALTITGTLNHDGADAGFRNVSPVAMPSITTLDLASILAALVIQGLASDDT